MKLKARLSVLAFAVVFALVGCGGQSGGGISSAARAQLVPLVQQVRRAADSRDPQGVQRALTELQRADASNAARGDISPARAAEILDAAAQVQRRLALVPTSTASTAPTTTTVAPDGRGRDNKDKHDNGNGNGGGGHD